MVASQTRLESTHLLDTAKNLDTERRSMRDENIHDPRRRRVRAGQDLAELHHGVGHVSRAAVAEHLLTHGVGCVPEMGGRAAVVDAPPPHVARDPAVGGPLEKHGPVASGPQYNAGALFDHTDDGARRIFRLAGVPTGDDESSKDSGLIGKLE